MGRRGSTRLLRAGFAEESRIRRFSEFAVAQGEPSSEACEKRHQRLTERLLMFRCVSSLAVFLFASFVSGLEPRDLLPDMDREWTPSVRISAVEAHQAAAADEKFAYSITNTVIAKYDRRTGNHIATSHGEAQHLNSGFLWEGKLYCAHSNYPKTPEVSEIKVLDLETLQLSAFRSFGNFGGSLTWAVRHREAWWCNFAKYGEQNRETFLVKFDSEWKELGRWSYPPELIQKLGHYSLSGGLWRGDDLLVTGHDDPVLFRLRLPSQGAVLELKGIQSIPFTGQGFASDPATGGLVGIHRAKRQIVFAVPSPEKP